MHCLVILVHSLGCHGSRGGDLFGRVDTALLCLLMQKFHCLGCQGVVEASRFGVIDYWYAYLEY